MNPARTKHAAGVSKKEAGRAKRKWTLPNDIDWRLVETCRRNGETWSKISTRTGISAYLLRRWAERLRKNELLHEGQGSRSAVDWFLIARLYREGKPLEMIATEAGLASGHSLSARITQRRRDGQWNLPKRSRRRSAALQ